MAATLGAPSTATAIAPGYTHCCLDTLDGGANIVAARADACTGVYVWRHAAPGQPGTNGPGHRARAPRLVTRSGTTTSFETRQLAAHGSRQALLVACGAAHSGVVVEWDCERERTRAEHVLTVGGVPAQRAPAILAFVVDASSGGSNSAESATTRIVGLGPRHLFAATLDSRAAATVRTPLAFARNGSLAGAANAWCANASSCPNYCCIASSADGRVAVGCSSGRVLLLPRGLGDERAICSLDGGGAGDPQRGPVRALALTRDGTWLCATYDSGVLVAGPFTAAADASGGGGDDNSDDNGGGDGAGDAQRGVVRAWGRQQSGYGRVFCTIAPSRRAAHAIAETACYRHARFEEGSGAGSTQRGGVSVVVALGRVLLRFPLLAPTGPARSAAARIHSGGSSQHDDDDDDDDDVASVGAADTTGETIASVCTPHARALFNNCRLHVAPATIVDHASTEAAQHEALALADRILAVRI